MTLPVQNRWWEVTILNGRSFPAGASINMNAALRAGLTWLLVLLLSEYG